MCQIGTKRSSFYDTLFKQKMKHSIINFSRLYEKTLELNSSSIVPTNAEGIVTYVNPTFCKRTGYNPKEIKGQNSRILKSGQQPLETYRALWKWSH